MKWQNVVLGRFKGKLSNQRRENIRYSETTKFSGVAKWFLLKMSQISLQKEGINIT
jgi:hypothetical protein